MTEKSVIDNNNSAQKKAESVSEFMQRLEHPLKLEIEALRQVILGANDQIGEDIKWNAPSFYIKDHFATFNLRSPDFVQIIFHRGAKVKDNSSAGAESAKIQDPQGLLTWLAKERCAVRFTNMDEVASKRAALAEIVKQWIGSR